MKVCLDGHLGGAMHDHDEPKNIVDYGWNLSSRHVHSGIAATQTLRALSLIVGID